MEINVHFAEYMRNYWKLLVKNNEQTDGYKLGIDGGKLCSCSCGITG